MATPIEITFKNMDHSEFIERRVHKEAAKLDHFFGQTSSIHVVIEPETHSQRSGNLYRVGVHIKAPPGKSIDVGRAEPQTHGQQHPHDEDAYDKGAHGGAYLAIRDAFAAARRQLQDHARRIDGRVKTHEPPLHGRVTRLVPGVEGYGFVTTNDGREIYFHQNSVTGDGFKRLHEGSEVRVVVAENEGEQGPHASTVTLIGKHHIVG
jgi:cold shock CspA family protein/ribosome-associated translation inhibitor RaiA